MKSKFLLAAAGLGIIASANAHATTVTVNATDDIYAAGLASPPVLDHGGGTLPSGIPLNGGDILSFSVTGTVSLTHNGNGFPNNPDGTGSEVSSSTNAGLGSIAGVAAPNDGFLVGLFVPAGGPTGPQPASLDFRSGGNVPNGTAFTSLAPLLDQAFFIGDGLTGDGTGTVQTFLAPNGAAMLYLGISDSRFYGAPGFPCCNDPAWYEDNSGTFTVDVSGATPLPAALPLFATCLGALGLLGWRRKRK